MTHAHASLLKVALLLALVLHAVQAMAQTTFVPAGTTWRYWDFGDQGSTWRQLGFNDSAWASGRAQLGYGEGDEATVVNFGNPTNKFITTYFRNVFNVSSPGTISNLVLRLLRDDGAIVYLNGAEVFRSNMPTGTVNPATLASAESLGLDEVTFHERVLSSTILIPGSNVIAVEVHQNTPSTPDMSFDLILIGNPPPRPTITQQPQSQINVVGTTANFRVTATGAAPLSYQWRRFGSNILNGGRFSGATTTNLVISNVQTSDQTGYSVLVSNHGGSVTSSVATLTVRVPPSITQQPQSRTVPAGTNVTFSVTATGTAPLSYQWRFNGSPIVGANTPNYTIQPVQASHGGNYDVVVSNAAGSTNSQVATLTVLVTYNLTLRAGWNLIANQLENGGNTLNEIFDDVPDGSMVQKYANVDQKWHIATFTKVDGWQPDDITLSPGEGAFFHSPENFTHTFRGSRRTPALPINIPPTLCYLLSRQIPERAFYQDLVGRNAEEGIALFRWSAAAQGYAEYHFFDGLWLPTEPILDIGEAAWICPGGGFPPVANRAPFISNISNQTTNEDNVIGPISFTVDDPDTGPVGLNLSATSSNPALVPITGISFSGTSSTRTVRITPATNQFGTSLITVTVHDPEGATASDSFQVTFLGVNDRPTISDIPNQTITEDTNTGPISFTIGDVDDAFQGLTLTAITSNPALVPTNNIVFGGTNSSRTVTVTPLPNQSGTNTITVTVTDPSGNSASDVFTVIVLAVNDPPTISNIADRTIAEDTNTGLIGFSISDVETPVVGLSLRATSSNLTLVPTNNIVFFGTTTRTVRVTPATNQFGSSIITVIVTDPQGGSASDTFLLTVTNVNDAPIISDISDRVIGEDTVLGPINFTIFDLETTAGSLQLDAISANTNLIPRANILFGGSGSNRTVTIRPATNQIGSNVITIIVRDPTLAAATDIFVVTVRPCPDLSCPSNLLVECQGPGATIVDYGITASSFCSPIVNVVCTPPDGSAMAIGTVAVNCVATDGVGNTRSCAFNVTVRDTTPPALTCPPDQTVLATLPDGERVFYDVPVSDLCDSNVIVTCTHPSGTLFPVGTTNVVCIARDSRSNVGRCSFNVTVQERLCTDRSTGVEFWLTFPGNTPDAANPRELRLSIAGAPGTTGTVAISDPFFSTAFGIPANGDSTFVVLPPAADLGAANDDVLNNGVHVTASRPVTVFAVNHIDYSTDGYLGLPAGMLGTQYVVLAYGGAPLDSSDLNASQFAIVATQERTTVTIKPSTAAGGHPAGVPYNLALNRGQTYQLRAAGDISGTVVSSDKPIAVFGSHRCARIPADEVVSCNYIVEQLLPTSAWGTEFFVQPLQTRMQGDRLRLLAALDNTIVTFTTGPGASTQYFLSNSQVQEIALGQPAHISANQDILVAQYATSSDFDGIDQADATMMLVESTGHYGESYMVSAPDGFANFITVITTLDPTRDGPAPIFVDGLSIGLVPAPAGGYVGTIAVDPGAHSLSSQSPFSVSAYGFSEFNAYAFPGGFSLPERIPPVILCPTNVTLLASTSCVVQVPNFLGLSQVFDNCTAVTSLQMNQEPPAGTFLPVGNHPITINATDAAGNVGVCTTTLRIVDERPVSIALGQTSFDCQSGGAFATYTVLAQTPCSSNLSSTCFPPSGSFFPLGNTTVTCVSPNPAGKLYTNSFTLLVPCLDISIAGTNVVLRWAGSAALQTATNLTGSPQDWRNLVVGTNMFIQPAREPRRFFRLRYSQF